MKATPFEFRLRFWIILAIYVLGFTAPWNFALHLDGAGPNTHVWGRLAVLLSKGGMLSIGTAFQLVLAAGILFLAAGTCLRTWGAAYLGSDVVRGKDLHGDRVVAEGPYRYVRNPLYLGSWLSAIALALLMPASGALFALLLMTAFLIRLTLGEEAFLRAKLGEPYETYCAKVPRLLPALRASVPGAHAPGTDAPPHWMRAVLGETFMWGMTASFAVLGWQYNALLLTQCVLVWLGVSLVLLAFATSEHQGTATASE